MEDSIASLEREISEIEEALNQPETASDYVKMTELCTRLEEAKNELEAKMAEWVETGG